MLRRSCVQRATLNKGVQSPGPTLHGWGRTTQKRRLEYETVDSKYHKREFNKNWDQAGCVQRSTDFLQMRVYFRYPATLYTMFFNQLPIVFLTIPTIFFWYGVHELVQIHNKNMMRAAWW